MILWRISNYTDLLGVGGVQTAGRWHHRGIPVVYLAENPALAMLEVLVHFELAPGDVPERFQLLEVDYPQRRSISRLPANALDKNWRSDTELTRSLGDAWLSAGSSTLLKVPSAIAPRSYNYLFNPRHPEARKARIVSATAHPYDPRLL